MKITFKVIEPQKGAFEKKVWEALQKKTKEWLEEKLRNVKCPEHHKCPQAIVSGSLQKPDIKIKGCCQELIDLEFPEFLSEV